VKKIENFFLVINHFTIQYNIIMSTIQFNSKGQRIEELDSPFEKVEPNIIIPSATLALSTAEPFKKVEVDENEILAWCEYYLHSKKIERKLNHIYFPSTFSTFSTFKKGGAK
jgi:hypothetical protein